MTSASTSHFFFFFNDTATTEIYTLSLHDALPIFQRSKPPSSQHIFAATEVVRLRRCEDVRSEEHTSELQSRRDLVCRLLLEKKKKQKPTSRPNSLTCARFAGVCS